MRSNSQNEISRKDFSCSAPGNAPPVSHPATVESSNPDLPLDFPLSSTAVRWAFAILTCIWALSVHAASEGDELPIRNLAKGAFSGIQEPAAEIIKDRSTWEKFWKQHSAGARPAEDLPKVDFEKQMVIAVTTGRKKTGGYAIEIENVKERDQRLEIAVKQTAPKPGAIAIQALTSPFHFVATQKSDLKPVFTGDPPPVSKKSQASP